MCDLPDLAIRHFTVSEAEAGQKLLSYLKRRLGQNLPESLLHRIIRNGEVRINGKRSKPFARLEENDEVRVPPLRTAKDETPLQPLLAPRSPEKAGPAALDIAAETAEYLLLNKPAGLPAQPGSKQPDALSSRLAAAYPDAPFTPTLAHRLDKDTSGLILAAKTYRALRAAQSAFRDHTALKDYLTWVEGVWAKTATLTLRDLLEKQGPAGREKVRTGAGKEALCEARPVLGRAGHTLLLVRLFTGRTHQIRVQLSSRGHPIAGDIKYGARAAPPGTPGIYLHAWRLVLPDRQIFTAPPSWQGDFAVAARILKAIPVNA